MSRSRTRSLVNLRDLGGLAAKDGVTRHGVLFRSEAPYSGDPLPAWLMHWPPVTVIDLRSPHEITDGHPWSEIANVYHLPLLRDSTFEQLRLTATPPEKRLELVYVDIVEHAASRLATLISWAAAAEGPVHVHCAAGKDRTGVAVAVLLLAAGVDVDRIRDDYRASEAHMGVLADRFDRRGLQPGVPGWRSMPQTAPPDLITLVIERLTAGTGDISGWARAHGLPQADLTSWRHRLVEPTA